LERGEDSSNPALKRQLLKRCLGIYCPNSITALQQLLFSGSPLTPTSSEEERDSGKKNVHCHITRKSQNISHMGNGIEYYSVEVTCENGSQYGIQAYGDEPIDLYKEIYKYYMCGTPPKELEKSTLVEERIDGTTYTFDNNVCALIFKLRSVMGEEDEENSLEN
jgi:hypothetical protein